MARIGDHCCAALLVITAGTRRRCIKNVGPVQRVVQAAPACVRGVQHKTVVEARHHQLRPRHRCDFGIDILRADGKGRRLGNQITDLAQECLIGWHIGNGPGIGFVPRVDLRLQRIAFGEQVPAYWYKPCQNIGKAGPKAIGGNSCADDCRGFGKMRQFFCDLQASTGNILGHYSAPV